MVRLNIAYAYLFATTVVASQLSLASSKNWCPFADTVSKNLDSLKLKCADPEEAGAYPVTCEYLNANADTASGDALRDAMRTRINEQMSALTCDAFESEALVSVQVPGTSPSGQQDPIAIVIPGPSAVGKSTQTTQKLPGLLKKNGITGSLNFVTVDGGILRDKPNLLPVWHEVKSLADALDCPGFKDAYETSTKDKKPQMGIAKDAMSNGKKRLQKEFLAQKKNVILPTTASNTEGEKKEIMKFAAAGYRILFLGVNADQVNAFVMGTKRAPSEGKKYSGSSWLKSVDAVAQLINWAREGIFGSFAQTAVHFVISNNFKKLDEWGGHSRNPDAAPLEIMPDQTVQVDCTPSKDNFAAITELVEGSASQGLQCDYSAAGTDTSVSAQQVDVKLPPPALRGNDGPSFDSVFSGEGGFPEPNHKRHRAVKRDPRVHPGLRQQ